MSTLILKGTLISAPAPGKLDILEGGYLAVEDGCVEGVYPRLPERYQNAPLEDFGRCLILQSFTDLHLHAPQYPMLGTGMNLPLLEWLSACTYPAEARFADAEYARTVSRALARELIENGTTRVCMFSSLHRPATLILMEELERAGVTGFVGKVNMDRNGSPDLQETTEESRRETLAWLDQSKAFPHIRPILTPRFTPSCTDELLRFLGKLALERNLPVQSHLSENTGELQWVRTLHPECARYWETYDEYGLWTDRTAMAHCVWSDAAERQAMIRAGVTAVHCPASNRNLCSGVAPVRVMLSEGVKVALGTDIAGGDSVHMFDAVADAVRASKDRRILDGWKTEALSVAEAWYLGTSAGASFFGDAPGFVPGQRLHAMAVDDSRLPPSPHPLSAAERFERCVYRRQSGAIRAVWSDGRKVFSRSPD
ncbi:MAG: amidohydrolase family protein [Oscillibacter sp.]|jgi:guanine deaminase|nr:amidohydrolase family protein [Oscillibacter sp.]